MTDAITAPQTPPRPEARPRFVEWLNHWADRFEAADLSFGHGTDNAWDEAVALGLGVLGWADNAELLDTPLTVDECTRLNHLAELRVAQWVPVPLLVGRATFAGVEFLTAPDVMIPRSPIAELVLDGFVPWLAQPPARVLDVCCGGGCIGLSVAHYFPDARVTLSDIDEAALNLARRNVEHLGLADRVDVVSSDLFGSFKNQQFDLIISNPPYVPSDECAARPVEFRHEPERAYDGGADGMFLVRQLLAGAGDLLAPEGLLVIEVGQWHDTVETVWPSVPFTWAELRSGGEGVMVLDAAVVAEHTAQFAAELL